MTAGLPIVAHNGTGIPCIVDDGVTGYVVDVRDVQKYTDALLAVLSDPALRQRMGVEGQRQAITRFGQAEVASQLFAIYAEVIGSTTDNAIAQAAEPLVKQKTSVHDR
jgi:glycosyltransferase involved in cell wall biosynthesis